MHAFTQVLFIAALSLINVQTVTAATIERYSDPVMGCTMLLSGEIVEGDAERLLAFFEENRGVVIYPIDVVGRGAARLCLNSNGGNFLEGIRLAQAIMGLFFIGTAVADGHVCESACAVAFMAGGYTEGGYFNITPILHPRGRLGFHAPSLNIPAGEYSEAEVLRAYGIALQAISEIVQLRLTEGAAGPRYRFPETLFFNMINTPADSMYYIDTVGQAENYGLVLFPSVLNAIDPEQAARNLCGAYYRGSGTQEPPTIRRMANDRIVFDFPSGYGEEAVGGCTVLFDRSALIERNESAVRRPIVFLNSIDDAEREYSPSRISAFAYSSFHPETPLASLPLDQEEAWQEFLARIPIEAPSAQRCWLTSTLSRITNVNDYVNLRSQPDFTAPVIRQVPRGEQVRPTRFDNVTITGAQRVYDLCVSACQSFGRNPRDRQAAEQVQLCTDDNLLWYEITDARGNRGWVSRRFLEEW